MKKLFTFAITLAASVITANAQIMPDIMQTDEQWSACDHFGCSMTFQRSALSPKDKKPAPKGHITVGKPTSTTPGAYTPQGQVYNDKEAMIAVSKDNDKWFFTVADSILGRELLAVSRFTSTPANSGQYGGENFRTDVFVFEKSVDGKSLLLRSREHFLHADTLDAISKAVKASSMDPIVATFKIEEKAKGRYKVDVTDFVLSDNVLGLSSSHKSSFGITSFNASLSYVESIHSYPINTEVRTVRTYNLNPRAESPTATVGTNTSFLLLPKVPMQPRIFDPRVGFFTDSYFLFADNQQQVERTTVITRRRLEPKSEEDAERQRNGELIEPKKQIVYYIDPATPKQWRPYLIQGVKDWNAAFEQAGWKNAITALEWPENDSTMSMEDSRYSVIMYLASDIANAYGPQNHDPRSGEILESHVGWYHNVMSLVHHWYQIQCGANDPEARNAKFSDELMGELIRFVSSHEIGHTLGLRHNFGASATVPVDSLRSNDYLTKYGFCPSIMDYARFNYVAQPEDHIDIKNLFPRINYYDKWAIEWGYKPNYKATDAESDRYLLNRATSEKLSANPNLNWYDGEGMRNDPRRQTEDLGDDAAKANTLGIENLKRIVPNLRDWNYWGGDNTDARVAEMYNELLNQFTRYCNHVATNLSGVYHTPLAPEQEGIVYQYPPKEKAQSVLPFFEKQVIEAPRWLVDVPYADRVFINADDMLERIADRVLPRLCFSSTITNVNPNYGSTQYLEDLVKAFFKDFNTAAPLTRYQRHLQQILVKNLCSAFESGRNNTATDVTAAIYAKLKDMDQRFSNAKNDDKTTEAHYLQMADQIKRALVIK